MCKGSFATCHPTLTWVLCATTIISIAPSAFGQEVIRKEKYPGPLISVALSPDGEYYAVDPARSRFVDVHRTRDGKKIAQINPLLGLMLITFSPSGKYLAGGAIFRDTKEGLSVGVRLWNPLRPKEFVDLQGLESVATSVVFSLDGRLLAAVEANGKVTVWSVSAQKLLFSLDKKKGADQLAFSPDGKTLAGASEDGFLTTWDAQTGKQRTRIHRVRGEPVPLEIRYSPTGKSLYAIGVDGTLYVHRASDLTLERSLPLDKVEGRLYVATISSDCRIVASGKWDKIILSDARTGKALAELRDAKWMEIRHLHFSCDGKRLISAAELPVLDRDTELRIWKCPLISK